MNAEIMREGVGGWGIELKRFFREVSSFTITSTIQAYYWVADSKFIRDRQVG